MCRLSSDATGARGPSSPTVADEQPTAPTGRTVRWALVTGAVLAVAAMFGIHALLMTNQEQGASIPALEQKVAAIGTAGASAASPNIPRLLVLPFENLSTTPNSAIVARGLTDEVIGQIAKFKEIVVIAGRSPELSTDLATPDRRARYVLHGSVSLEGEKLRLSTRLLDSSDQSVIWANSYDKTLRVREVLQVRTEIARQVATAIAQPYGIIFHAATARMAETPPNDWAAYACTLAYYAYRANLRPKTHRAVMRVPPAGNNAIPHLCHRLGAAFPDLSRRTAFPLCRRRRRLFAADRSGARRRPPRRRSRSAEHARLAGLHDFTVLQRGSRCGA